jgi:putative nucleotidyltransferase with HDIG domain
MPGFFSRLFGGSTTRPTDANAARPAAPSPRESSSYLGRADALDMEIFPAVAAAAPTDWTPRVAEYWADRTAHVLDRLRREWQRDPEYAKWPDVELLLSDLAGPPDALVRQLPAAARDAMALCDNADLARSELGDRLSRDPSLVQGLLRQANGAFYGAGLAPILRVDAAIDRIGLAGTRAVVLAACVDGLLSKPGAPYDGMLTSVWAHMVSTGPMARSLAAQFGADPEEAFAIALLHDVGKLVIFDRISALRTTHRRSVLLPDNLLALILEQLHEPLGAVAVHRWGLGARAADAIGSHHRRERPALRHPLAETLFLAERAEHAAREKERFDFDGVWGLGQLPGDPLTARGVLGRHLQSV